MSIDMSKRSISLGLFLMVAPGSLFVHTAKPSVSARCEHLQHTEKSQHFERLQSSSAVF